MFLLLPEELIKAISSEVGVLDSDLRSSSDGSFQMDIHDVKSLRLTCKASSEILASQVLHSITINISHSTIDRDVDKLQCLATRPCTSATTYATHELTIKSLSPAYPSETIIKQTSHTLPVVTKKVLFDALSSFQNVQSVSYVLHPVYTLFALFKILFG
jgi:hypothetical protein